MKFSIDKICADHVEGWAVSENGIKAIIISIDGRPVATAQPSIKRPDVAADHPDIPSSEKSGFVHVFREQQFRDPVSTIGVEVIDNAGERARTQFENIPTIFGNGAGEQATLPKSSRACSPFPLDIEAILSRLKPEVYSPEQRWSREVVEEAIADLRRLIKHGSRSWPALCRYVLYLKSLSNTFKTIERLFPRHNKLAGSDGKDLFSVASNPDELLCISHHLLVLTTHGLRGPVAEFGCFKGFSTSCLSHACQQLGLELHVFDSFSGLPDSTSPYYNTGEFTGFLEETAQNIRTLGKIDCVKFFKGYFSETVPHYREAPIAIWMDVDLLSSATDVAGLLPRLPPESIVFTHEARSDHFADGEIILRYSPDEVLPPIVDGLKALGRHPTGTFLGYDTGAVWDRYVGIPPLSMKAILSFCASV